MILGPAIDHNQRENESGEKAEVNGQETKKGEKLTTPGRKRDGELLARALQQPSSFLANTRTGAERGIFPHVAEPATVDRDDAVARLNAHAIRFVSRNHPGDDEAVGPRCSNSDTQASRRIERRKHHQAEVAQKRRDAEMDPPRAARAWHRDILIPTLDHVKALMSQQRLARFERQRCGTRRPSRDARPRQRS
jgi:hypothetical protein